MAEEIIICPYHEIPIDFDEEYGYQCSRCEYTGHCDTCGSDNIEHINRVYWYCLNCHTEFVFNDVPRYFHRLDKAYIRENKEIPTFLRMSDDLFNRLWNIKPKEREVGKIMGKRITFPRRSESVKCDGLDDVSYLFAGLEHEAHKVKDKQVRKYIEELLEWVKADSWNEDYNQILINWYEGNDYIGPHYDKKVKDCTEIYSFSFGDERDFIVTPRKHKEDRRIFRTGDNTLLIMGRSMQCNYKHAVPKRAKNTGRRINITFRVVI